MRSWEWLWRDPPSWAPSLPPLSSRSHPALGSLVTLPFLCLKHPHLNGSQILVSCSTSAQGSGLRHSASFLNLPSVSQNFHVRVEAFFFPQESLLPQFSLIGSGIRIHLTLPSPASWNSPAGLFIVSAAVSPGTALSFQLVCHLLPHTCTALGLPACVVLLLPLPSSNAGCIVLRAWREYSVQEM